MFYRLKQGLYRFMYGRYGVDQLSKALLVVYFVLWALNIVMMSLWVSLLLTAVLFVLVFRMFSKNIDRRRRENAKYLKLVQGVKGFFSLQKQKWAHRKTARYRKCPHCKANIKLPNKKGRHTVECPRCRKDFKVHISI